MRCSPASGGDVVVPGLVDRSVRDLRLRPLGGWLLLAVLVSLVAGCGGKRMPARYAHVLQGPEEPRDVAQKIRPPSEDCRREAVHAVRSEADILSSPLPHEVRAGYAELLRGLHPLAKQVLRRTSGVWFATEMPGASARFVPCDGDDGTRGLILVDVDANPLEQDAIDVDVPTQYWRLLGGGSEAIRVEDTAEALVAEHKAARYVLLHEIGHALSLLSGEFVLNEQRQFELPHWKSYASFSWRPRRLGALGDELHEFGGVVPVSLGLADWREIRRSLGSSSTFLAPGYRRSNRLDAMRRCHAADRLPRAGFVTPTAATAPTEDYAELFAHAVLAAEGKLHPDDVLRVQLPGCEPELQPMPYFVSGVADKRAYMEAQLGLSAMHGR